MAETTGTGKKINAFAKAQTKTAAAPSAGKRTETVWSISPTITDTPTRDQLNKAVSEVHRLTAEAKKLETQNKVHKSILQDYALTRYVETLAATGAEPPSPLKVSNEKGETVTYVVQDRGHLTNISDQQYTDLVALLGEDGANKIVYEGGEFKFAPLVMSQLSPLSTELEPRTVQDVVAEAITTALEGLVATGALTQEQSDGLLSYESERRFKPGLLGRVVETAGRNVSRIGNLFGVLSSAVVRYVKA